MQTRDPNLTKIPIDAATTDDAVNDKSGRYAESSDTNGTQTLNNDYVQSEHVNDGDNPARQPDRRDQQGSTAFDDNINENTTGTEQPQSGEITDRNRYATIDNAQARVLNEDLK